MKSKDQVLAIEKTEMSQDRRHRAASHGNSALLFIDIDDELEDWTDSEVFDASGSNGVVPSPTEHLVRDRMADLPGQVSAVGIDCLDEELDLKEDDALLISLTEHRSNIEPEGPLNNDMGVDDESLSPGWDWGELDEFDPDDEPEADEDALPSIMHDGPERIAIHDKSERAAAKIIRDAMWERQDGLPVLTEILIYHRCHTKTIGALRELAIVHQVEPDMLSMLHEIRAAWRSHGYNRIHSQSGARDGWVNLPWGIALHITDKLGVQSASEVMEFVDICFNDWCDVGFGEFPIFAYYLNFVVSNIDSPLADTIAIAPEVARAMLTDRGEQYDLPGNPVDKDLGYYGMA